jgi:predicted DNA-binding antitoxin AbrB/MazE fold protein
LPLAVEAVYENGDLKLAEPLALQEHQRVRLTIETTTGDREPDGIVGGTDSKVIEWAALDADLEYPPRRSHDFRGPPAAPRPDANAMPNGRVTWSGYRPFAGLFSRTIKASWWTFLLNPFSLGL